MSKFNTTNLKDKYYEYIQMLNSRIKISDKDVLYIQTIINENIEKEITLTRDTKTKDIKILLDNKELLNQDRGNLHLSAGEQNFISLTFELLKAKNTAKDVIIMDDPISSFDSIYKNKLAFAIIKFLEGKKQIIFTHNLDLVRLLEVQLKNCFNLYLLNNVENEVNGFINVSEKEKEILLYIDKFLNLLRNDIFSYIEDERLFLISMISFMRGYAQLIGCVENKNKLTSLMYGYETSKVEISAIYTELMGIENKFENEHSISVCDILNLDIENITNVNILKGEDYKLLNKTLQHTLTYLYLRLKVEKVLVDKFKINTNRHDMLGKIIRKAFANEADKSKQIFLTLDHSQ